MDHKLYQLNLRELIRNAEIKCNAHTFFGWPTAELVEYRHGLLKLLVKDQIKNFDRRK